MPVYLPPLSRRRFLKGSLAASALAMAGGCAAPAAGSGGENWALLSDIHIAADPKLVHSNVNMTRNLRAAVEEVLVWREPVSGVLINGDLAFNSGETADYAAILGLLRPAGARTAHPSGAGQSRSAGAFLVNIAGGANDRAGFAGAPGGHRADGSRQLVRARFAHHSAGGPLAGWETRNGNGWRGRWTRTGTRRHWSSCIIIPVLAARRAFRWRTRRNCWKSCVRAGRSRRASLATRISGASLAMKAGCGW